MVPTERDAEDPAQAAEIVGRGLDRDARAEVRVSEADFVSMDAHLVIGSVGAYLEELVSGNPRMGYADDGE